MVRRLIRGTGELLLTAGVVLLLLVVYQLWWTNVSAARAADAGRAALEQTWAQQPAGATPAPTAAASKPALGDPIALLYVPRLRDKVWAAPVLQGVGLEQLAEGVGHYPRSAMPGELGNFALAAHRATHGEPFRDIDRLRDGDQVIVETKDTWYVYVLDKDRIVQPTDVWVVDPVPGAAAGTTPTRALITLTTCNPRWASYERWIWWGTLSQTLPKSQGTPAAITAG
ncbi:MAG: class E sortase [Actinomycetota bacterium]|nr:MAG: class E sortase [Actinomycetota bacterium]